ncbi:uncharacterized protein N7473_009242 [Penicillium subrubescens]|uniref:Uncharacterized protein n=1 Tax=Penicillium subrubescens TaxID=1316194 RepID=A0A1Q5TAH5_9EURO|nr:uncharacterized protein N7473_009242 [Penicillium subrubescens]KAJ5886568.1 hypothetical protein N7473_009242 [Penicillium subrubescens]OKO97236.1 hypothetical protein PENSUB_10030 [Penicillium subrubescens]
MTTIESIIPTMTTFSTGRVPMPSVAPSEAPPPPSSPTKPSAIDNLARIPAGLWVLIFLVVGFILTGGTFFFIKRQKAKPRNEVPLVDMNPTIEAITTATATLNKTTTSLENAAKHLNTAVRSQNTPTTITTTTPTQSPEEVEAEDHGQTPGPSSPPENVNGHPGPPKPKLRDKMRDPAYLNAGLSGGRTTMHGLGKVGKWLGIGEQA